MVARIFVVVVLVGFVASETFESRYDIENYFKVFEDKLNQQQNELETMKSRLGTQDNEILRLKAKLATQDSEILSLKAILATKDRNLEHMADQVSNILAENVEMEKRIQEQEMKMQKIGEGHLNQSVHSKENKRLLEGSIIPSSVPVKATAFYAYMSTSEPNPQHHHPLIFDVVKTNVNSAYSPLTGVFRIPTDGTYVLTFSFRISGGGSTGAYGSYEIVKNGVPEGASIGILTNQNDQIQVECTIVIEANQGDECFVRTNPKLTHTGDLVSNLHGWSMFAGWQISN